MIKLIYECRSCGRCFVVEKERLDLMWLLHCIRVHEASDLFDMHKCNAKGKHGLADLVGMQE